MIQNARSGAGTRKVLFVLGSGVSSGICPNVRELTEQVLSQEPKRDAYYGEEEFKALTGFLNVLKAQVTKGVEDITYEDLFSMCEHLQNWELNRVRDPTIRLFRDRVFEEARGHWAFYTKDSNAYWQDPPLATIALKAQERVHTVIGKALIDKREPRRQLDLIAETVSELGPENVDILTLNHDCLVEALLDVRGVAWTDGFDPEISEDGDIVNFDARAFADEGRVRIVKLHGGCDWVFAGTYVLPRGKKHNFRWIKKLAEKDLDSCCDRSGKTFYDDVEKVAILTGTTTKTSAYIEGIHAELYLAAKNVLSEHDHIICSGYGWRDTGFNTMLRDWATKQHWHQDQRCLPRLLLLHKHGKLSDFRQKKNPQRTRRDLWFWPDNWCKSLDEGWSIDHSDWMRCHKKWLACTRLSEIKEKLFEKA